MNESFDEWLKEKLIGTKYPIPQTFERKVDETIKEIELGKVSNSKRVLWLAANKAAGAVILVVLLLVVSVSSYAAVNLFQKRMNEMPERVQEKYNEDVQKSNVEADAFSRSLTDSEEEKMLTLRKQYEREGKFPQNEITQVSGSKDIVKDGLYFVAEESKFYLPERTLSEEEMLEIIDLQEKRDFSVRQQNLQTEKPEKQDVKNVKLEQQSVEAVAGLFNRKKNELEVVSTQLADDCYEYTIKNQKSLFSVYGTKENGVERVVLKKDHLSAHQSDVKRKSLNTKRISERLKKRVEIFSGKKMDSQSVYSLCDREFLTTGTVSYYYQMKDGSGCVAVYSTAYQDLYDIYLIHDVELMQEEIRQKIERAKDSGYRYQLLDSKKY